MDRPGDIAMAILVGFGFGVSLIILSIRGCPVTDRELVKVCLERGQTVEACKALVE